VSIVAKQAGRQDTFQNNQDRRHDIVHGNEMCGHLIHQISLPSAGQPPPLWLDPSRESHLMPRSMHNAHQGSLAISQHHKMSRSMPNGDQGRLANRTKTDHVRRPSCLLLTVSLLIHVPLQGIGASSIIYIPCRPHPFRTRFLAVVRGKALYPNCINIISSTLQSTSRRQMIILHLGTEQSLDPLVRTLARDRRMGSWWSTN